MIEQTTQYAAEFTSMEAVWSFVMRYLDELGGPPTVQIYPCESHDDDEGLHYHVIIAASKEVEQ